SLFFELTVFCARVEYDPLGIEAKDKVIQSFLILGSHIQRDCIHILYRWAILQLENVFTSHLAFFDPNWYYFMPILFKHISRHISISGRVGGCTYYYRLFHSK